MKLQAFKHSILWVLLLGITIGYSQKSDKKVEKFKVDANPTLEIVASHTDVTIESWNKKEILVEATIEIEGATEEQAQNILDTWNFKALGNSKRVEVQSFGNVFIHNLDDGFEFDFVMPEMVIEIPEIDIPEMEIVIPEFEFEMPEIVIPEFVIEIPEMEFEFEIDEFDYDEYEKDSTYLKRYKAQVAQQVEAFKASGYQQKMDSLRNSKEFKEQMKAMKAAHKQAAIQMKAYKESEEYKEALEARKEAMEQAKEQMRAAREQMEVQRAEMEVQKELVEKQRAVAMEANRKAMKEIKKAQEVNKNIKIKRKVHIKAPKDTKYDLNVKHGKLDVPESAIKMSARVSYGNFVAGTLSGEDTEVVVANSPVVVNAMMAGNITLRNVPNAVFGTFSDANLFSDHSEVLIEEVGENVSMSQKFGFLEIDTFAPNFQNFNLILDYAKAEMDVTNRNFAYVITGKNSTFNYSKNFRSAEASKEGSMYKLKGVYGNSDSKNTLNITGVYSTLTMN